MFRCSAFLVLQVAAGPAAQSDSPFALHAGTVYARLPDIDAEKVTSIAIAPFRIRSGPEDGPCSRA